MRLQTERMTGGDDDGGADVDHSDTITVMAPLMMNIWTRMTAGVVNDNGDDIICHRSI